MNIPDILELLMPNILTVATQLLATAILFTLMYLLAWKPVKRILDARSEYEQSRLTDADELKEESEMLNEKANEYIEKAKIQAQETIRKAQEEGLRLKNNLLEEGKQKSQQLVEEAQYNITLQKNKMLEDMHQEIVNVAITAAEKMLQEKLDSQSDIDSIESFINEVTGK
ncbi:MAG TPA: F0F1 ATP synthase subunit B [Erysipelotrichaceae bacterium]|jgi:F-type H+-transporting ATPase subunit b|nr:F0F1 ATP synthase subunit B [Erysipelotrichaceae bacterium]HQA84763.1 F0F1 ATP synthase subunit B [Erysipelotrichaceae bacterium]